MRTRRHIVWALGAAGLFALAITAPAANEKPPQEETEPAAELRPKLILRTYDISDFLYDVPDYGALMPQVDLAAVTGAAGDIGDLFVGSGASREEECVGWQEMVDLLTRLVSPAVDNRVAIWADEGGPAAIEFFRGSLLITQTRRAHERIAEALDLLRKTAYRTVLVDFRWIHVEEEAAGELLADLAARPGAPQEVGGGLLDKLGAEVVYRARISCLDGQRVYVSTASCRQYISDAEPVVSENASADRPEISGSLATLGLRVVPVVLPDGKSALVEIKSEVSETALDDSTVLKQGRPVTALDVKLPQAVVQKFGTTVCLPLGKDMLIGGMNTPNERAGPALYLLVRVSVSQ